MVGAIPKYNLRNIFLILISTLIVAGLVYLASAGIIDGQRKFDDGFFYVKRQISQGVLLGFMGMLIAYFTPLRIIRKSSPFLLILSIITLVALFVPSLAPEINGAHRWLFIGPLGFQPSEFLKIAVILYLSSVFAYQLHDHSGTLILKNIIPQFIFLAVIGLLLLKQPDVGTLGVIGFISLSLLYFANIKIKSLLILVVLGAVAMVLVSLTSSYRFDRLKAFFDPHSNSLTSSYHINQATIGIGTGGWLGLGYGRSQQKTSFLPEPVGDSIFAVIVEENGFIVGAIIIMALFGLGIVVLSMASVSAQTYNQLLIYGFASWIIFQSFIHVSAITAILPLTGVPLPFISYGSSSTVALLTMAGVVLNAFTDQKTK